MMFLSSLLAQASRLIILSSLVVEQVVMDTMLLAVAVVLVVTALRLAHLVAVLLLNLL